MLVVVAIIFIFVSPSLQQQNVDDPCSRQFLSPSILSVCEAYFNERIINGNKMVEMNRRTTTPDVGIIKPEPRKFVYWIFSFISLCQMFL